MQSTTKTIAEAFSKNRTEELSSDVWQQFVVPLYFDEINILGARKPIMIIGGRGCGKTMLLRYFSHQTQFSPLREASSEPALDNIGLYWRIDTQFATAMKGRGLDESQWQEAFTHFLTISIALEIFASLKSMSSAKRNGQSILRLESLSYQNVRAYDSKLTDSTSANVEYLFSQLATFETWVSNVKKIQEPIFYPGIKFLEALVKDIRSSCQDLSNTVFHVFLDEFENLLGFQQRVINTRIKHSEDPLIFSVAMKRGSPPTIETVGGESITDISDYRRHDLEDHLRERDFGLFAAEVFCLHLSLAGFSNLPVAPETLRDENQLSHRRTSDYRKKVEEYATEILPGLSSIKMAELVFSTDSLRGRLERNLRTALKIRNLDLPAERFMDSAIPRESIVCQALLHRPKLPFEDIVNEFDAAKMGESRRFGDWLHNNFVGCLLWLYDVEPEACPFFAGFEAFQQLAKGNLRHFLELCHKSLANLTVESPGKVPAVPIAKQSKAARQTSVAFLREIRSFGIFGNKLHAFVLRLGSVFALAQRRKSQSEPEQNHFSVKRGLRNLGDDELKMLNEAIRWSVLFEVEETKLKEAHQLQVHNYEYILNPIYSPYFNISYRKRRRLEMSTAQFQVLASGSYDEVRSLLADFSKAWSIDLTEANPTLFSHFSEILE